MSVQEQLAEIRDHRFALLITLVVGLAAETHPDELRAALSGLFDTASLEEWQRRAYASGQELHARLDTLRQRIIELEKRLSDAEGRLEQREVPLRNGRPGHA